MLERDCVHAFIYSSDAESSLDGNKLKNTKHSLDEMAQQLKALADLENTGSVPRTHIVVHRDL